MINYGTLTALKSIINIHPNKMEKSNQIEKLFKKFIARECSKEEVEKILDYLKSSKDTSLIPNIDTAKKLFKNYPDMDAHTADHIYKDILKAVKDKERKSILKKPSIWRYAAAAIVIALLTTTYVLKKNSYSLEIENETIVDTKKTITPGTDQAILTLEDGTELSLAKGTNIQTKNASSNGENLIYKTTASNNTIKHNYLTIPRGGQFHITLADGTEVWLNSESQLKYPVAFTKGKTRQVELIYGEAYFKVSPSTAHNGDSFKVFNRSQEVEVLGTEFNIKAYKEEHTIYTTLVEGKVTVQTENKKQQLQPNQQLSLNTQTQTSTINHIDVYNEVAWKEGIFSFDDKTLKDMMIVLSRWYNVDFVIKNKSIENELFVGTLRKNQDITEILTSILKFGIIKNFKIDERKIILE